MTLKGGTSSTNRVNQAEKTSVKDNVPAESDVPDLVRQKQAGKSQSVLDALADAETLQSFLGDHGLGHMGTARPAVEAEASGKRAASWMTADRDGFLFTAEDLANRHGIDAARAAFRAVPGLRG